MSEQPVQPQSPPSTPAAEVQPVEAQTAEMPSRPRKPLRVRARQVMRALVLLAALALTAFWIYTFYAIAGHANPKGDGLEWAAAVPLTLVFLLLTLPALIIGLFGRALIFGLMVAAASAFVNAWIWLEVLAEFKN